MQLITQKTKTKEKSSGFSLPELVVTTSIIGILSAVAIPSYVSQLCRSESANAIATIGSIQAIIAAYTDETGVSAGDWDDLNSISAIMSNDGQMSGSFGEPMSLPNGTYEISVTGPADSLYYITAKRTDGCPNRDIRTCLDVSTGASDLKQGNGTTNSATPNCS